MTQEEWHTAQRWERNWWGTCHNTFGEEYKQLLYAEKMGLSTFHDGKSPFNIDLDGRSVLDIGGGPASLLLKCVNGRRKVIDPLRFPLWVLGRYVMAGVELDRRCGEDLEESGWDECWIYNVLQHTENPALVVEKARRAAGLIRIFEWIGTAKNEGHPHVLSMGMLDEWLGGEGKVERINGRNTCKGVAYYGIFPT